jgi:ABC-2 type transport system ATP-binding protein
MLCRLMSAVVQLDNLSVRLGPKTVLDQLNGSFSGRCIGLLGPNGAGKSTLINTLLGFYKPRQGSARVLGFPIDSDIRRVRALTGYMPEHESFIGQMTAVAFIRLMAELSGLPQQAALERAHEALFYVGLGEARYRTLATYSQGMKQLAKLAQAIAHGPRLVILDEPTNGLDPPARQRMIRLVREIRDTGELQLILCSHLLRDVEECCDAVIILKEGRIVHYSNLEEERRANRRFLEMETYGDDGSFAEAVARLGCECTISGSRRMKIILPERFEMNALFRAAAERNVQLRRLNFRRDSLEDIFLKAMEGVNGRP